VRRIAEKRARFQQKVDRMTRSLTNNGTQNWITEYREEILELNFVDLASKLRSGELDPVEVLEAYQVGKLAKRLKAA